MVVQEEVVGEEEEVTARRRSRCDGRCLEGSRISVLPGHTPKGRRGVVLHVSVQLPWQGGVWHFPGTWSHKRWQQLGRKMEVTRLSTFF